STLTGRWVDLPGGQLQNTGMLTLRVESNDRLVKIGESIPYGGSVWARGSRGTTTASTPGGTTTGRTTRGTPPGGTTGGTPGGTRGGTTPGATGGLCADPRALALMDQWLAAAIPPQQPGESLHYDPWGRLVGRTLTNTITAPSPPDTTLTRCEYL